VTSLGVSLLNFNGQVDYIKNMWTSSNCLLHKYVLLCFGTYYMHMYIYYYEYFFTDSAIHFPDVMLTFFFPILVARILLLLLMKKMWGSLLMLWRILIAWPHW